MTLAVRLEIRRGLGRWIIIPLIVAGLVAGFNAMGSGNELWPYAVSALGQVGQVMGSIAAGAAALAGTRFRRRNTELMETLAVRSPLSAGLSELAALLIWTTASIVVVVAALFVSTAASATAGGPDVPRTVAAVVGILAQVSVGYAAGRLIPYRLTPLVVAAGLYTGVNFVNSSTRNVVYNLFLPENLNLYDEFNRLNRAVAPAQLVWYLGLAVSALAVWGVCRRTSVVSCAVLALGVAFSAGGFVAIDSQHGLANAPGVFVRLKCAGANPQICVNPAFTASTPALRRAFAPVVNRVNRTPFAIGRVEQRPRGMGSAPDAGSVAFGLDDSQPATIRFAVRELAENTIAPFSACRTPEGPLRRGVKLDGSDVLAVIADRVVEGRRLITVGTNANPQLTAAARFDRLDDDQLRQFLVVNSVNIKKCLLQYRQLK